MASRWNIPAVKSHNSLYTMSVSSLNKTPSPQSTHTHATASYVLYRGSVPLYWEQRTSMAVKPGQQDIDAHARAHTHTQTRACALAHARTHEHTHIHILRALCFFQAFMWACPPTPSCARLACTSPASDNRHAPLPTPPFLCDRIPMFISTSGALNCQPLKFDCVEC